MLSVSHTHIQYNLYCALLCSWALCITLTCQAWLLLKLLTSKHHRNYPFFSVFHFSDLFVLLLCFMLLMSWGKVSRRHLALSLILSQGMKQAHLRFDSSMDSNRICEWCKQSNLPTTHTKIGHLRVVQHNLQVYFLCFKRISFGYCKLAFIALTT